MARSSFFLFAIELTDKLALAFNCFDSTEIERFEISIEMVCGKNIIAMFMIREQTKRLILIDLHALFSVVNSMQIA